MSSESKPARDAAPDWTFHFETGRPCLDVVATVGDRARLAFDRWRRPQDLSRWCVEARLLNVAPAVEPQLLEEARALRESIYRTIHSLRAGGRPQRQDIQAMNRWAARPALAPQLGERSGQVRWVFDAPIEAVLSTIARDAIALVASQDLGRVHECASESCSVLFLDASRPGMRRWCSMNRCGNRTKKSNYRRRLRAR
jgi:predicted RNA-binding Zn ribbon-like protein